MAEKLSWLPSVNTATSISETAACPSGWHLPSDAEWTVLTDFLGGEELSGPKMKSTSGWNNNN
jgi:uncharacterized protein (TIGR02145 family)